MAEKKEPLIKKEDTRKDRLCSKCDKYVKVPCITEQEAIRRKCIKPR